MNEAHFHDAVHKIIGIQSILLEKMLGGEADIFEIQYIKFTFRQIENYYNCAGLIWYIVSPVFRRDRSFICVLYMISSVGC
jgi:hypothetical protein